MLKRTFDIIVSLIGLVVLTPLILLATIVVRASSPGPVLFRQKRMGRHFVPFQILKFRTMVQTASATGRPLTTADDPRVTAMIPGGPAALITPPEDPAALAEAVRRLMASPDLRASLARAGRELVRTHFDRAAIAVQMEQTLEELLH